MEVGKKRQELFGCCPSNLFAVPAIPVDLIGPYAVDGGGDVENNVVACAHFVGWFYEKFKEKIVLME